MLMLEFIFCSRFKLKHLYTKHLHCFFFNLKNILFTWLDPYTTTFIDIELYVKIQASSINYFVHKKAPVAVFVKSLQSLSMEYRWGTPIFRYEDGNYIVCQSGRGIFQIYLIFEYRNTMWVRLYIILKIREW